jgi:hypothetical protein
MLGMPFRPATRANHPIQARPSLLRTPIEPLLGGRYNPLQVPTGLPDK